MIFAQLRLVSVSEHIQGRLSQAVVFKILHIFTVFSTLGLSRCNPIVNQRFLPLLLPPDVPLSFATLTSAVKEEIILYRQVHIRMECVTLSRLKAP